MRTFRSSLLAAALVSLFAPAAARADGDGFPRSDRPSLGLSVDAGHKRYGNQVGTQLALRWHGAILGGSWAGMTEGSNSTGATSALGLVVGYGYAFSGWRVEATGGWGRVSAEVGTGIRNFDVTAGGGHYLVGRLGLDRHLLVSGRWSLSAGVGAWHQRVTQLGAGDGWSEFGCGLRLGGELGL